MQGAEIQTSCLAADQAGGLLELLRENQSFPLPPPIRETFESFHALLCSKGPRISAEDRKMRNNLNSALRADRDSRGDQSFIWLPVLQATIDRDVEIRNTVTPSILHELPAQVLKAMVVAVNYTMNLTSMIKVAPSSVPAISEAFQLIREIPTLSTFSEVLTKRLTNFGATGP